MEFFSKILSALDPDYWETYECPHEQNHIVVTTACSVETFERLHESICKKIFNYLSLEDLKCCRLVCTYWNKLILSSVFKSKSCFFLDGERFKWKFFTSKSEDLKYVSNSKFSIWTSMRFRKVSTDHVNFLMANYDFSNSVKHISHVKLVECCFEWKTLIKFLRCFENLESFVDIKGQYYIYEPFFTRVTHWLRKVDSRSMGDISNTLDTNISETENAFWKLKNIAIVEDENKPSVTEELLNFLSSTTGAIDQVKLEVGKLTGMEDFPQRQTEYWSNILYYLRMKDIKKLQIVSTHAVHVGFSNRFLTYFSLWRGVPGTAFSKLTNLMINIMPIQLWKTFQDQFVPFIRTLKSLQLLTLKMIMMRESQEHLVHSLAKAIPQNCVLQLGVIIDDYGGVIAAYQIQQAMMQKLYFDTLNTLYVIIMTDSVIQGSEIIPANRINKIKYLHVKDLTFTKKYTPNSSFYTYNIDVVVRTFPNLTKLTISDEHSERRPPSGALITDDDVQLILKKLKKLEKISLTANMVFLSDTGMTGQSKTTYRRNQCSSSGDNNIQPTKIYSFSDLKNIKYISFEGLGSLITDNTAYLAFNGTEKSLQHLKLIGTHKISEAGKSYLKAKFIFSKNSQLYDKSDNNNNENTLTSDWNNGIPDTILESIFDQLGGQDLKNCREVCKIWSIIAVPLMTSKTCVVYDCSAKKTKFKCFRSIKTSRRLVKFLSTSTIGFTSWNEMRVKGLDTSGMTIFLKRLPEEVKLRTLQNITCLEIKNCCLKWARMLSFLRLFENLKSFVDIGTHNYMGNLFHAVCGDQQSEFEYLEEKFGMKPLPISSLKIIKKETNSNLTMLLKLYLRTSRELESFELKLHNNDFGWIPTSDRTEFVTVLGFLLLKQTRTLQNLSFEWCCSRSNFYFDDFLQCLSIMFVGELQLSHLNLQFEWIALNNDDVEGLLIPFIQRFVSLQTLNLGKIILTPESAGRLERLRPSNSPNCECDFDVVFSDHNGLDTHQRILQVLDGSPVILSCVRSIRVAVSDMFTFDLARMLSNEEIIVEHTYLKELMVNLAFFPLGTEFNTFNINKIIYSFPNLTTLWIFDGPRFLYKNNSTNLNRQWHKMSQAKIGDVEMQMIIEGLRNLKNLRLRARMSSLTDCGLTGLSPEACSRIITTLDFCYYSSDVQGSPLSSLKHLEEVMLKGVGGGITDVTMYFGFNDMPKLKVIHLYGSMNISNTGRNLLAKKFPQSADFAYKECLGDGTWFRHPKSNQTWSNYTTCIDHQDLQWRRFIITFYELGYFLSICALLVSLIIFCSFKCLECTRVRIHKHLFVSFIISNLMWMAWHRLVVNDPQVLLQNSLWCQGLHLMVMYFMMANYFWMFCEGFYLHTLLVFAFLRSETQLLRGFYVFGWLGPAIPMMSYYYFRANDGTDNQACWVSESKWSLIQKIPVCLCLALSLAFLINILRVLVTKLKDQRNFTNALRRNSSISAPDNHNSLRKAVRATLILIPLLGLHYFVTPFRPNPGTKEEAVYEIVAAATSSLQGLCVSLLFCFCNSEVLTVFRRTVCRRLCIQKSHAQRPDSCNPTNGNHETSERNGTRREILKIQTKSKSVEMEILDERI